MRTNRTNASCHVETEIDKLLSTLRWHAMENLIATRLGASAPKQPIDVEPPRKTPDHQQQEEYDQQLRRFIRRWYRGKPRKPTEDELDEIVASAKEQIENGPDHGIYPLDVSIPRMS